MQLLKAGILEIADAYVVSKRDHPLAYRLEGELRSMLETAPHGDWTPPILVT